MSSSLKDKEQDPAAAVNKDGRLSRELRSEEYPFFLEAAKLRLEDVGIFKVVGEHGLVDVVGGRSFVGDDFETVAGVGLVEGFEFGVGRLNFIVFVLRKEGIDDEG